MLVRVWTSSVLGKACPLWKRSAWVTNGTIFRSVIFTGVLLAPPPGLNAVREPMAPPPVVHAARRTAAAGCPGGVGARPGRARPDRRQTAAGRNTPSALQC